MISPNKLQIVGICSLGLFLAVSLVALFQSQRDISQTMAEVRATYPDVPRISADDLWARMQDGNGTSIELLDVRTADEFAVSHLPGARRVEPYSSATRVIPTLNSNRTAVLYCSAGHRSSDLGDRLLKTGYTNLLVLDGSIFGWGNAGRPLERDGKPVNKVHPYNASAGHMLKPEYRGSLKKKFDFWNFSLSPIAVLKIGSAIGLFAVLVAWESLAPFYLWFRQRNKERVKHGLRNVVMGILNNILVAVFFIQLWWLAANWSAAKQLGLLHRFIDPGWVHLIAAVIIMDFWTYCWHRLNHHIPFLWRFHRTHHSDLHLDVTSASRFHLGEIAFSSLLRIPVIMMAGIEFSEILIYETLLFASVQFQHANITLSAHVDRWLQWIVVTPNMHRVHHSREREETDSNFSSLFSIWDRLFATWMTRDARTIELGLSEFADPQQHTLVGMMKTPLNQSTLMPRGGSPSDNLAPRE